jgi:hypothetical protein
MDQIIANHSLNIDQKYENFINNFCSTTGSNFPQGKLGNYLGSWYEGFIFCLLLGLNTDSRHYKGYEKKYQKMPNWSSQNTDQYKYCIAKILSREDIIKELQIDNRVGINKNFKSTEDLLNQVKEICDQFSLGGLHYLIKLHENDSTIFNDPLALKTIYENSLSK